MQKLKRAPRAPVFDKPVGAADRGRGTVFPGENVQMKRPTNRARQLVPLESVGQMIGFIRERRIMLDVDLAALYGVETRALVQAVKRNRHRFPPDFMFQLDVEECSRLRSQIVISKARGGRRYAPYVFTEQGVAMLSSVLKSHRAIQVNIHIMRAFVRLREVLATHRALARKLEHLERKYDAKFKVVFDAIRALMASPAPRARRPIGFLTEAADRSSRTR